MMVWCLVCQVVIPTLPCQNRPEDCCRQAFERPSHAGEVQHRVVPEELIPGQVLIESLVHDVPGPAQVRYGGNRRQRLGRCDGPLAWGHRDDVRIWRSDKKTDRDALF